MAYCYVTHDPVEYLDLLIQIDEEDEAVVRQLELDEVIEATEFVGFAQASLPGWSEAA